MTDLIPYWQTGTYSTFNVATTGVPTSGAPSGPMQVTYVGRTSDAAGNIPVIWCHQNTDPSKISPWPTIRDGQFSDGARSLSWLSFPTFADHLGGDTAGNDLTVLSGGLIDQVISYAGSKFGTRTDKVLLWGDSLGGFNVLNWAWRNPGKILGVVLRVPGVALEALHDRNPFGVAAVIEAAYGGGAGYLAALPTHDPMQNLDLIRPFGHRIKIWYGDADVVVPATEIEAFGTAVGAELRSIPGNHDVIYTTRSDETSMWLYQMAQQRAIEVWDWQRTWGELQEIEVTRNIAFPAPPEQWQKSEVVAVGSSGRRGRVRNFVAGSGTNERRFFALPEFRASYSEIYSEIHSWDSLFGGQQGNVHRVIETSADSGQAHVIWQNFFLSSPWILNFGVWVWDVSAASFVTNQSASITPIGMRTKTGGMVLGSSRVSNVYTFICEFQTVPVVGDIVQTFDIPNATFVDVFIVTSVDVDAGTFTAVEQTPSVQPDEPAGGSGTFANHIRGLFPYALRTRVYGPSPSTVDWKVWPLFFDEPEQGDPAFSGTHVFNSGFSSAIGKAGFLIAHLAANRFLDQGRLVAIEL